MSFPKITIITPSFNQGHFIEQTILSVIEEGYPNLEYIILDGGSIDNTIDVIKKYERHITFWKSEKDKGQSDAINQGFRMATGDIINWLNSDDYYEKGTLHKVAEVFYNTDCDVFCGRSRVFGLGKDYWSNGSDLYGHNLLKTVGMARIDQPETFFRHSVLKEISYLNEFLHFTMDKEMWMRYLLKNGMNKIHKTKDLLVHYRLHPSSKTVSLQRGFIEETHSIYYTYAKWFLLEKESDFLKSNFSVTELPLKFYEDLLTREKVATILNYYFLQQALVNYAQNNYSLARLFVAQIRRADLIQDEINELDKVISRMKIPIVVKNFFNYVKTGK